MTEIEKQHMVLTLECAEVVNILNIPKTQLRNWTIGRPLKIAPSIKIANGTGSRNLWNWLDLIKLAAALMLTGQGVSPRGIKDVLNEIEIGLRTYQERPLLVTMRHENRRLAEYRKHKSELANGRIPSDGIIWITINLKYLVEVVDRQIYIYYKKMRAA